MRAKVQKQQAAAKTSADAARAKAVESAKANAKAAATIKTLGQCLSVLARHDVCKRG